MINHKLHISCVKLFLARIDFLHCDCMRVRRRNVSYLTLNALLWGAYPAISVCHFYRSFQIKRAFNIGIYA